MKVDIIGTGLTAIIYDWSNDSRKYSVGSALGTYGDRIDTYFCMHKGQDINTEKEVITLLNYPLEDIELRYKTNYFNNSIAYMIAYALYNGATEINLWGCDAEKASEYEFERPCIAYWIGIANSLGCKVKNSSGLTEPPFKYGYEQSSISSFLEILSLREKAYRMYAEQKTGDEKQQWIGAMYAMQKMIDIIKG